MPDPDFARMTMPARFGVVALCLGAGAALGVIGTFAHQSLPPLGLTIALATVGLFVVGLRVWGGVRALAAAGALGIVLMSGMLASATSGSMLVPGNPVGYAWLIGILAIAFLALAWPHVQRTPRRTPDTMEESSSSMTSIVAEAHPEQKERSLP